MKKNFEKFLLVITIIVVAFCGLLAFLTHIFLAWLAAARDEMISQAEGPETIADISYGNIYDYTNEVYIKEEGGYTPYLVISDDYNGNVLLMRKELWDEPMRYHDETINGAGGNYYPNSKVNQFLNNEFLGRFSSTMQEEIVDTEVEVASWETIVRNHYMRETEIVHCKIFLLSATEYGVKTSMNAKEGEPIKCLDEYEVFGEQWLRSAYLWDDVSAWVTGEASYGENLRWKFYVRPVFTLPPELEIEESTEAVEGGVVYVLTCDE